MRIVIDTDSKELCKEDYGCLVPFTTLTESEQKVVGNAILDTVAKHNLCSRSELLEDMIHNLHRLVKSGVGGIKRTDSEDENTYKFCTNFNDIISVGSISDVVMKTRITTKVEQYTYKQFR